jgi:hypothetical protein
MPRWCAAYVVVVVLLLLLLLLLLFLPLAIAGTLDVPGRYSQGAKLQQKARNAATTPKWQPKSWHAFPHMLHGHIKQRILFVICVHQLVLHSFVTNGG